MPLTGRNPDGKSDTVKVKLTAVMVHQIFAEKPHVKRAFQANVPTRIMTHNQFWAKYLRHQLLQQVHSSHCRVLILGPSPEVAV